MIPQLFVDDRHLTEVLDKAAPSVKAALEAKLAPIGAAIAADANARTAAHVRFLGVKNPGSLASSFKGGLTSKGNRITGWARSGHPLAHLMELGFEISDWEIVPGTGKNTASYLGAIMAFGGSAGDVFRQTVHRHATRVAAYPALSPAYEERHDEIMAALEEAAQAAGG